MTEEFGRVRTGRGQHSPEARLGRPGKLLTPASRTMEG
jgi:hypothetical protein